MRLLLLLSLLLRVAVSTPSSEKCRGECRDAFVSLFHRGSVSETLGILQERNTPCKYFYMYFISSYFSIDRKESAKFLCIALDADCHIKDLAYLVYASKIDSKNTFLGTHKESALYYKKVADKVFSSYFKKRVILFHKWDFKNLKKERENIRIIEFIKTLTKTGDTSAAENLFSLIKIGHVDAALHMDLLKQLARSGRADAMGLLGNIYLYGWGVKQSTISARHYFSEGAKKNNPDCLNGLGVIYLKEEKKVEAFKFFERASSLGLAAADYNLYLLYKENKNFLGELHLMKAAKQKGYLPAVYTHGVHALERKEYSVASAQFKGISLHYSQVLEIEKDAMELCKKKDWTGAFLLSVLLGELGSIQGYKNALFILQKKVSADLFKQINTAAVRLVLSRRVSDAGDAKATIEIGDIYYYGRGVEVDKRKAFSRYLAASLMGSPEGDYLVGWMYEHGEGVAKSLSNAKSMYGKMYKSNRNAYLVLGWVMLRVFLKEKKEVFLFFLAAGVGAWAILKGK